MTLPRGWAEATIAELIAPEGIFVDGDWIETKDQDPEGDVRLIQLADVGDGAFLNRSHRFLNFATATKLGCTFLHVGDVLVARMPDPLGRAAIFPGDARKAVTAVDVCIIRTGRNGADHRWLMWRINSPVMRQHIAALQSGTTRKRISRSNLATIRFSVAPFAEQTRIVAEIEKQFTRLDKAVAALKRVQANLKRYRAAVLNAACEGRLVPTEAELARKEGRSYETGEQLLTRILKERHANWEADQLAKLVAAGDTSKNDEWKKKYKEPQSPDLSSLPMLPDGWNWALVEQLNPAERPCAYGVLQPGDDVPDGTPFVRVGDIDDGYVDAMGLKKISPATSAKYPRTKLRGQEVLITLVGAIGRTAVVPESLAGANTARAVGVIPLIQNEVSPRWVEIWFRNPTKVALMTMQAHEVARKTLNLEDVRAASVALPPLPEQFRIVEKVEDVLSLAKSVGMSVEAQLVRADRMRQSILKRAFEGRLVPQDPNDEPASTLLDRIKAERLLTTSKPIAKSRGKKSEETTMSVAETPRSIIETLRERKTPASPEQLFKAAGYTVDTIDEFYADLKSGIDGGHVLETRSPDDTILLQAR